MARAVGAEPTQTWVRADAVIACWSSLAPPARFEADRACAWRAWTGRLEDPTGSQGFGASGRMRMPAGDYALVGLEEASLLLARSEFGGRPLYYQPIDGGLVACSRLAPLVESAEERPALNRGMLVSIVAGLGPAVEEWTVHDGIYRVRSPQVLRFDLVRRSLEVCDLRDEAPLPDLGSAAPEELAFVLRDEIFRAVARSTGGARNVAVMAGGGLDSSGVLAAAVAHARDAGLPDVRPLALDFGGAGDDRPHLSALCRALRVDPLKLSPASCSPSVVPALVMDAAPYAWASGAWEVSLGRAARSCGSEVVLSGGGGDELLDGFPDLAFGGAKSAAGKLAAAKTIARLRCPWTSTPASRLLTYVVRPLVRSRVVSTRVHGALRGLRARRAPAWAGPLLRSFFQERAARASSVAFTSRTIDRIVPPEFALANSDMRQQIEVETGCLHELPLVDGRLVRFVAALPPVTLLHGGRIKGLFRAAMKGVLPESLRLRDDKAEFAPAFAAMTSPVAVRRGLAELGTLDALGDLGLVEPQAYRQGLGTLLDGADDGRGWLDLWPALSVEAFVRGYRASS